MLDSGLRRVLVANDNGKAEFNEASERLGSDIVTAGVVAKYSVSISSLPSGEVRPVLIVT